MFADEAPLGTEAERDEAIVADHDALQTQEFGTIQRMASGLTDGAAPALDAVLGRALALDGVARSRFLQQQEGSRTCEEMARDAGVPGRLFLTRYRGAFSPSTATCRLGSTTGR